MAGIKRKDAPGIKGQGKSSFKKVKTDSRKVPPKVSKSKPRPTNQETETDSDPIVESDTTEHSGDDDGASWPSDEEQDETPEGKHDNKKQSGVKPSTASDSTNDGSKTPALANGLFDHPCFPNRIS